jgi:hypothetical protein
LECVRTVLDFSVVTAVVGGERVEAAVPVAPPEVAAEVGAEGVDSLAPAPTGNSEVGVVGCAGRGVDDEGVAPPLTGAEVVWSNTC